MAGYRTVRGIALAALALLAAASSDAETPLSVAVVTVEKTQAVRHLSLTGELAARETLNASFPTGGRIAEIAVDDGDRVRAGTVIARIERFQQEQALLSAQAQLTAADAELTAARDDNARQTSLLERGATTRAAQDAAEHRLAAAVARRAQAEAELARAQEALDDTVLRASAEATVIRRLAEPGQVVGAAQPILELAQGDGFDAVFEVPEALLSQASATAPPEIRLSPLNRPGIWVAGQVREISPLVNTASGTVEVKVALEVPLPGLSYGDAVRGRSDQTEEARVALPWSAISATAGGEAVWVVDPETFTVSLRAVVVERYTRDAVLLRSGVEPGEVVVSQGAQLLFPGRKVKPLTEDE